MPFIPHTPDDTRTMLARIGAATIDDLFDEIDPGLMGADFGPLAEGVGEMEMLAAMSERARRDQTGPCFTGAGCYDHHVPAAVWDIASRGEFMTAYTPYQAEASQGTLQVIYEYQSMMTALTAMDVTNASVYDGGSALGESVLMAVRASRRRQRREGAGDTEPVHIAVAGACHPLYLDAARTITRNQGIEIGAPSVGADGRADLDALKDGTSPAAVIVQQPNFLGLIERVDEVAGWAASHGALLIGVVNPTALALLKPPGEWGDDGADIVCGDGQPLGIPMASGGPSFGFLCARQRLVRQLPGRIVGRTVDSLGRPGFTLTLQAREQHIRRAKATSNICTNQGLLVTAATVYLAVMGAEGLRRTAARCHARTRDLVDALTSIESVTARFAGPFFHEAVIDIGRPAGPVAETLAASGIVGGLPLGRFHPELDDCLLVCATEKRTDADIAAFRLALTQAL